MSRAAAAEMVTLHEAGKTAPLTGSNDVNQFVRIEDVDHHFVAGIRSVFTLKRNFTDKAHRCGVVLFEMARHWLVDALWFHKLDESELNGIVAVFLFRLLLNNDAGSGLNNRHRNDGPVILQQLRHADFFTK